MRSTFLGAAAASLVLTACGAAGEPATTTEESAFDGAVKFARCMRERGVDMPDPQRQQGGGVRIGGPGFDPGRPEAREAEKACRKHLRFGDTGPRLSPKEEAKARDAFLKYARCMRERGIDVPDPKPGQPGVIVRQGGPVDPESSAFQKADDACRPALSELRRPR